MRKQLRNRIIVLGSLAAIAIGAGACMVEEDVEGAADEAALAGADLGEAAIDEAALADLAVADDVGDTSEPVGDQPADVEAEVYTKPGTGPVTTSLHRGRARVGWPAAGIDICPDIVCFNCFYPRNYDKVFHQNHIVYVDAICGDAAAVHDNYGNHGMMRKAALYNW